MSEPTPTSVPEPAAAAVAAGGERTAQQFVMFDVGEERFAFPLASVKEIIRVPDVVRVPLSPPTLEGLANLRGQVLPVLSLRRRFSFAEVEHTDATRVVVVEQGGLMGFVVDRVASVTSIEPEQIEKVEEAAATIDRDLLTAMIKGVAGHTMVMVLDIGRLVDFDVHGYARSRGAAGDGGARARDGRAEEGGVTDERQLVSFVVAGQEYAFAIERVQEIVQVPDRVSRIPNAPSHVLGVMMLRNRLLPLVSLRQMFGLPVLDLDPQHRIVVISLSHAGARRTDAVVGIVMDAVNEVLRVPARLVDGLPSFLARTQTVSEVESICRLDEGKRLVSILSVDQLFAHAMVRDAVATQQEGETPVETEGLARGGREAGSDDEEQFVVFRLAGEEYGVAIDSVQEIIRVPETMTRVPRTVSYLEGLVNLRGQVLPVVDLRKRFGLEVLARDERQRVVVFSIDDVRTGFIVDSVSEVLKIARATIDPIPELSEEQARLMGRVAKLEAQKRMILVLEARQLLSREELGELAAAGRAAARTAVTAA